MKRSILAVGTAACVAAVSLVAVAAAPASASTSTSTTTVKPNSYISAPTGLHNAPSTQAPAVTTLPAGKHVEALCFIPNGENIDGNENWFRIAVDDQLGGWVPRAVVGGAPGLPRC